MTCGTPTTKYMGTLCDFEAGPHPSASFSLDNSTSACDSSVFRFAGRSPSPERASSQRMENNRTSPSSTSDSPPTGTDTSLQQRVQKIRRVFTIIRNFCADISEQSGEAMTKLLCSVVVRISFCYLSLDLFHLKLVGSSYRLIIH